METFKSDDLKSKAYRSVFIQKGGSVGYINNMQGEGLGNYFGNTIKQTIPLTANTIKGVKPKTQPFVVTSGAKRKTGVSKRFNKNQVIVHRPHKKAKRKWRNL